MSNEVKLNVSQSRGYENANLELIKVTTNEQGQQLVSGRELHQALKVQQDFTDWIKKQLGSVDAVENEDFTRFPFKREGNNATLYEYVLTLDIAKEICMCVGVSPRTNEETRQLSKQIRKYFIECEKKSQQIKLPQNPMEVMELMFHALKDTNHEVAEVKADLKDYKENSPLYNVECDELQKSVKKKAVELLGGKSSNAYKDKSIRQQVFGDLQKQIKREFRVDSYKAIKRCQLDKAKEIVADYKLPFVLEQDVYWINNQMSLI